MDVQPTTALGWLRAALFVAKVYVLLAACFIGRFGHFSNDAQIAVMVSYAATALLLFAGGIIQLFTADRPRASLNFVMGVFALIVLMMLLPVLAR